MEINTSTLINARLIKSLDEPCIRVPVKLPGAVNYLNPSDLIKIHKNPEIAKERCLYFCSFLQDIYLIDKIDKVRLNAKIIKKLLGSKYVHIIASLENGTENGPIIECDRHYQVGAKSRNYCFTGAYTKERCASRLVSYKIETEKVKKQIIDNLYALMMKDRDNAIINNLYHVYPSVGLPTNEQLREKGEVLVNEKKTSKKGKVYRWREGNQPQLSKAELKKTSFIDEGIERFELLTEKGFVPPHSQGIKAGNRISDTFTNLDSWIREEVTINGQRVADCDFKCLHPNLAINLYGGGNKYLTHKRVAEYCGIDTGDEAAMRAFKFGHLAFFNKKVAQMKRSTALYEFYQTREPEMLRRIETEKESTLGHTATSAKLFAKEVKIMTKSIEKLNAHGIYVLYVFDALLCEPYHKPIVERVMNETALECGVYTATYDVNAVFDRDSMADSSLALSA